MQIFKKIFRACFVLYHRILLLSGFSFIRGCHSVSSFSKPSCLQRPSLSHQLPPYLLSLNLKIFFLVSLFFSFPVTPFASFFFLHSLGLFCLSCPYHLRLPSPSSSFLTFLTLLYSEIITLNRYCALRNLRKALA